VVAEFYRQLEWHKHEPIVLEPGVVQMRSDIRCRVERCEPLDFEYDHVSFRWGVRHAENVFDRADPVGRLVYETAGTMRG